MKSMTGFGRGSMEDETTVVQCEVKQVNHRYLDVWLRLPESYGEHEGRFRDAVSHRVKRGRIEVRLTRNYKAGGKAPPLQFDDPSVARAIAALAHLKDHHGVPGVIDLPTLLSFPGLQDSLNTMQVPKEAEVKLGLAALEAALEVADEMRREEGGRLKSAIAVELDVLEKGREQISGRSQSNAAAVLERLRNKLTDLVADINVDPQRVAEEAAIFADRLDITEEIQRFASHTAQMRGFMEQDEPVGKRMDFLIQELMRETNTIGAKSRDAGISHQVVELKAALERAREQIQNVE